jgi:hypothetical protein
VRRHLGLGHLGVEQRLEHGDAVGGLFDEREYDALAGVLLDVLRQAVIQHLNQAGRDIRHPLILFGYWARFLDDAMRDLVCGRPAGWPVDLRRSCPPPFAEVV